MATKLAERPSAVPVRDYVERDFGALRGLKRLPDPLVDAHLKLYSGYVANTNRLHRHLAAAEPGSPEWAGLQRRMGFELNGLRLHELYFDNLLPGGSWRSREVGEHLAGSWKSASDWERDFRAVAALRGVGWAILYRDPVTRGLSNHWISLHQEGHPAGFTPILVLDLWEHAFTGMERARYVDAFFDNMNWSEVESRLRSDR